jgi:hypothetical protein
LTLLTAEILHENTEMQRISRKLGFHLTDDPDDGCMHAELAL